MILRLLFFLFFVASLFYIDYSHSASSTYIKGKQLVQSNQSIATSAGITQISSTGHMKILLTGAQTHTLKLPSTASTPEGASFNIINNSTQSIIVNDFIDSLVDTIAPSTDKTFILFSGGFWAQSSGGSIGKALVGTSPIVITQDSTTATFTLDADYIETVETDSTLTGSGTIATPLKVNDNLAVAETLRASTGFVTSLNKADGSFEKDTASWSASVGTIVRTASTEIEGNYLGNWAGTGTGTLDFQWAATASNTYEARTWAKVDVPADYQVCALVNSAETGCKVLDNTNWSQLSVIADSIKDDSFYLRLKHTGAGAFSVVVDDAKIIPWNPQAVITATSTSIVQSWQDGTEWTSYTPTSSGFDTIVNPDFKWKRDGSDVLIVGKLTTPASGVSGTELRIGLPSGLISSSSLQALSSRGVFYRSTSSSSKGGAVLIQPSKSHMVFGTAKTYGSPTADPMAIMNGDTDFGNNEGMYLEARIPIEGWSSTPTLLALPASKENIFSAVINSDGTIKSQRPTTWISGVTKVGSKYSLAFNSGTFSALPAYKAKVSRDGSIAGEFERVAVVANLTTSGVDVYTQYGSSVVVQQDSEFTIEFTKQGADYTPAGVFVGNVAKNQVAYLKDVKANGVDGGTFTSGAWQTRTLNNVSGDTSIVSLSSNVFTLQAGEYEIEVEAPAWAVNRHRAGIGLDTDTSPSVALGMSFNARSIYEVFNTASVKTTIKISTPTAYKIMHRCETTAATSGFGIQTGSGFSGTDEIYTQVKITKLNGD